MGKLKRKKYERELEKLQVELVGLQEWVKKTGARIVVIFEGRDAAGKGGVNQAHHCARQSSSLPRSGFAGPNRA